MRCSKVPSPSSSSRLKTVCTPSRRSWRLPCNQTYKRTAVRPSEVRKHTSKKGPVWSAAAEHRLTIHKVWQRLCSLYLNQTGLFFDASQFHRGDFVCSQRKTRAGYFVYLRGFFCLEGAKAPCETAWFLISGGLCRLFSCLFYRCFL